MQVLPSGFPDTENLELIEVMWLVQGQKAYKCQKQDLNQGLLTLGLMNLEPTVGVSRGLRPTLPWTTQERLPSYHSETERRG